jgi:hypothetical protein
MKKPVKTTKRIKAEKQKQMPLLASNCFFFFNGVFTKPIEYFPNSLLPINPLPRVGEGSQG